MSIHLKECTLPFIDEISTAYSRKNAQMNFKQFDLPTLILYLRPFNHTFYPFSLRLSEDSCRVVELRGQVSRLRKEA